MMYALLWVTNKRYWRPSDGAQKHMTLEVESVGEWELVGIKDGRDGELHRLPENFSGGGVRMMATRKPPPVQ